MNRSTLIVAATAALLLSMGTMLQAAPVAEVISYDQSGLKASDERIHQAIKQAAEMRKWGIISDKPGKVLLVYPTNNRSLHYQATVSVTYGKGSYKVEYVKSRGLDERPNGCYGKEGVVCVHRTVNRWIANLGKDLNRLLTQNW